MNIAEFKVEEWLNPKDPHAIYNMGASCVKALSVEELFDLVDANLDDFLDELKTMSLHYGHFFGLERLLKAISNMYENVQPENIITVHGGTGANNVVMSELIEPGDNVIAIIPNYQQHYAIPESLGATVKYLELKAEDGYLPDLNELRKLIDKNTKMITLSNPNNPTGSFIERKKLKELVEIAKEFNTYILCDEIYRGLQTKYMTSISDIYDLGISTNSMSKVFSMAGTRLGWITIRDKETYKRLINRRSYDTICCGPFDEWISAIALENYKKILKRSRAIVNENKKILDEWIVSQPKLSRSIDSLTTTAFITYNYDVDTETMCTDMYEKESVLLCHGDCFEIPKTFRLGYGFGRPAHFRKCLDKLSEYLKTID